MVFSALTFLVAIPTGVKVFNWVATIYKGSIRFESPMLYAPRLHVPLHDRRPDRLFLGALSTDIHLHDTYFVVAHFHYVMVGGTVIAFVGGLHYWWPKMFGLQHDILQRDLDHFQPLHGFSSIGSYILGLGFLVLAFI
jgi:cytochrome c oxidase subunit 1